MTQAMAPRPQPPGSGPRSPAETAMAHRRFTAIGVAALLATAATAAAAALACGGGRPDWPRAVAWAAAICLPGSLAAWIVSRRPPSGPAGAVASSLAAVVLRLIPPLAGLAWLSSGRQTSDFRATGGVLVIFYLSLLAVDILLHMMGNSRRDGPATPPD